ncbi:hypothetical protein V3481_019470 [Fusarium oxysporum f. sp. vasinfectum]
MLPLHKKGTGERKKEKEKEVVEVRSGSLQKRNHFQGLGRKMAKQLHHTDRQEEGPFALALSTFPVCSTGLCVPGSVDYLLHVIGPTSRVPRISAYHVNKQ